jgi:hypothetical protein
MKSNNDDITYEFPRILCEIPVDATLARIKVHELKISKWTLLEKV